MEYISLAGFHLIFVVYMGLFLFIMVIGMVSSIDMIALFVDGKPPSYTAKLLRKMKLNWLAVKMSFDKE